MTAHGPEHWQRVARNGAMLAERTLGADPEIVDAFAFSHDAYRENEYSDPDHGLRAAENVLHNYPELNDEQMVTLCYALVHHDRGFVTTDPTVGVCWDADRLDLPRIGIVVNPVFLSTEGARNMLKEG